VHGSECDRLFSRFTGLGRAAGGTMGQHNRDTEISARDRAFAGRQRRARGSTGALDQADGKSSGEIEGSISMAH
jgi:hypothetical protein